MSEESRNFLELSEEGTKKGNRLLDELMSESGIDAVDLQMALMTLEAENLVNESSGRYSAAN